MNDESEIQLRLLNGYSAAEMWKRVDNLNSASIKGVDLSTLALLDQILPEVKELCPNLDFENDGVIRDIITLMVLSNSWTEFKATNVFWSTIWSLVQKRERLNEDDKA